MDGKNLEALTYGPEWMLAQLANFRASKTGTAVAEFVRKYGELYPGWGTDHQAEILYAHYAQELRWAWQAKASADKAKVSQRITRIFERDITADKLDLVRASPFEDPNDPEFRPAVVADFESGRITVKPRTLLDWIANSLLEYREKLAICERNGCKHPYFVKRHTRQKFCSNDCANSVRQKKKEEWWAKNRERFIKKWQSQRRTAQRKKRT